MKYVRANNLRMAYEETGKGIPIIFVHGFPLNHKLWEPQLSGLKETMHVIAPDLPGHGESEARSGAYLMNIVADDTNGFIDALGISEPVVICGLSLGGYMLGQFYQKYGQRLRGVIFTATRASPDSEAVKLNRDRLIALARQSGPQAVVEEVLPKFMSPKTYQSYPELVDEVRGIMRTTSLDGMVGDLLGMRERPDTHDLLRKVNVPALVIHGMDDQLIPLSEGERIRDTITGARMCVIPDAGHLPNLEQPELFNQAVIGFIPQLYPTGN
jgi:pimeloyl-ACP methyl ester carboxylesterase